MIPVDTLATFLQRRTETLKEEDYTHQCPQLKSAIVQVKIDFCQAQFQLGSPMPVELRLDLSLIITTTTHPPGKVEIQLEIGHIWSVGS